MIIRKCFARQCAKNSSPFEKKQKILNARWGHTMKTTSPDVLYLLQTGLLVHLETMLHTLYRPFSPRSATWFLGDKERVQAADPAIRLQIYPCPLADPGLNAAHWPMREMKTLARSLRKNSPPTGVPLHFPQLYPSTLGGVIAERSGSSQCVSVHVCFSLLMRPPVVDVLPWEGVNPLDLDWADVSAHHSVLSVLRVATQCISCLKIALQMRLRKKATCPPLNSRPLLSVSTLICSSAKRTVLIPALFFLLPWYPILYHLVDEEYLLC